MIPHSNVTFRTTADGAEIIELRYPDGTVGAFPVDEADPETGNKWRETYAEQYGAFKKDPDSARKSALEREIEERQNELKTLQEKPKPERAATVQPDAEPDFDNMSEDELRAWISANGGEDQRSNASHASLVSTATALNVKLERRKARAAAKADD